MVNSKVIGHNNDMTAALSRLSPLLGCIPRTSDKIPQAAVVCALLNEYNEGHILFYFDRLVPDPEIVNTNHLSNSFFAPVRRSFLSPHFDRTQQQRLV